MLSEPKQRSANLGMLSLNTVDLMLQLLKLQLQRLALTTFRLNSQQDLCQPQQWILTRLQTVASGSESTRYDTSKMPMD